jgi:glucokinase
MSEAVIVGDIGGTHARFALACPQPGALPRLDHVTTLATADYPDAESALGAFMDSAPAPAPRRATLAAAAPPPLSDETAAGAPSRLSNGGWTLMPDRLADRLALEEVRVINDLEAAAHAVAHATPADLAPVCGPRLPLPDNGVISVVGPGTGLGAAMVVRHGNGQTVIPTEAGHIGFAPTDGLEDLLLTAMRRGLSGRVSAERLVSGPGLAAIHLALGGAPAINQKSLWMEALESESSEMQATLERFLALLGSFTGDVALAQGARAVVMVGGLGARLGERLSHPAFAERFCAKGRFSERMARIPVLRFRAGEPGLLGAALA